VRAYVLILGASILLFGCAVSTQNKPAISSRANSSNSLSEREHDCRVMDVLLTELLQDPYFAGDLKRSTGEIVLGKDVVQVPLAFTPGYSPKLKLDRKLYDELVENTNKRFGESDREGHWKVSPEGIDHFQSFQFNRGIIVEDSESNRFKNMWEWWNRDIPHPRGYVLTSFPGYSADGNLAMVRFGFGPSSHGAVGFAILKKAEDQSWKLHWHELLYFL